jgi:hypothetical protein
VLGDASSSLVDADPLLGPTLKSNGAFPKIEGRWLLIGLLFMIQGVMSLLTTFWITSLLRRLRCYGFL